jgi:hypothetical protein
MKKFATLASIAGTMLCFFLPATSAQAQATRTWVSGVGDDANPCSRTAPCKTFAGAISKTASAGIIDCIDAGGFGAVTITKSITIDCSNVMAGVLVSGTNAINVPTASIVVNLRGLDIEGIGTGLIGVNVTAASTVHIDNCKIYGFQAGGAAGISFVPAGAGGRLIVTNSRVHTNGTGISINGAGNNMTLRDVVVDTNSSTGVLVNGAGATIDKSTLAFNGTGLSVVGGGLAIIGSSLVSHNTTGVSGTVQSWKNNEIGGNGTDGTPLTAFPGPGQPLQ